MSKALTPPESGSSTSLGMRRSGAESKADLLVIGGDKETEILGLRLGECKGMLGVATWCRSILLFYFYF